MSEDASPDDHQPEGHQLQGRRQPCRGRAHLRVRVLLAHAAVAAVAYAALA
jgi:hypothetical protein